MQTIRTAREELVETIPVQPGGTFFVQLARGAVDIESHDENEIRLVARATGLHGHRAGFSLAHTDRGVHLDMALDGWLSSMLAPPKVRVLARVPRDYSVDVETHGGRVEVSDIGGECAVRTSGSRIQVSGVEGDVELKTSGGEIRVDDVAGDVTARTSGGKVVLHGVDGDCDLQSSGGTLCAEDVLGRIDAKSSGGKIRAQFAHCASGRLSTSGGSIDVAYPRGTGVTVEAKTSGGSVDIAGDIHVDGRADKSRIDADLDGGGLELELQTSGGSIAIRTWVSPATAPDGPLS